MAIPGLEQDSRHLDCIAELSVVLGPGLRWYLRTSHLVSGARSRPRVFMEHWCLSTIPRTAAHFIWQALQRQLQYITCLSQPDRESSRHCSPRLARNPNKAGPSKSRDQGNNQAPD